MHTELSVWPSNDSCAMCANIIRARIYQTYVPPIVALTSGKEDACSTDTEIGQTAFKLTCDMLPLVVQRLLTLSIPRLYKKTKFARLQAEVLLVVSSRLLTCVVVEFSFFEPTSCLCFCVVMFVTDIMLACASCTTTIDEGAKPWHEVAADLLRYGIH